MASAGVGPTGKGLVRPVPDGERSDRRVQRLRRESEDAARDPLFLCDLVETEAAFASADAETARMVLSA